MLMLHHQLIQMLCCTQDFILDYLDQAGIVLHLTAAQSCYVAQVRISTDSSNMISSGPNPVLKMSNDDVC